MPELIRTSPLAQHEWQVLGLIYSDYSNEQITGELEVMATVTRAHIRSLHRKLDITHHQTVIRHAQKLLKMMSYGM